MHRMFPFGFDEQLQFYLIVYVLTLIVHVFLMAYVLAGSLWLAWVTLAPGHDAIPRTKQPLARILRDWMPFALSGAITAGVAPLLFVQILYRQQFYTANLLLGWRWMVVIPVLVTAFYLLYVLKSRSVSRWTFPVRLGLSIGVATCFLFVAFCWTANHLLSLNSTAWPEAYRSGEAVRSPLALLLRLATWVAGTFPTMSILAAWQLRGMRTRTEAWDTPFSESDWTTMFSTEYRRLGVVSIVGLAVSFVCAAGYLATLDSTVRGPLLGTMGRPWVIIVVVAAMLQIAGWVYQIRRSQLCPRWLTAISFAVLMMLSGGASLREIIRLTHVKATELMASTKAAAAIGGFELFVVFTALNAGLIAWCIQMVRTSKKRQRP
jgi:hypothetical protein